MRKIIRYIFVIILLFPVMVFGEEIDVNEKGSINIFYRYGDINISKSNIYLYKIANVNNRGEFTYTDEYELEDDLEVTTASEWNDKAINIDKYIIDNDINYLDSCVSDDNGECSFDNLEVGLYLIKTSEVIIGDYKYLSSPSLVSVPNYNEIDYVNMYDIDVVLKSEAEYIEKPKDDSENNDNTVPFTMDMIYNYLTVFGISLIAIVLIILYMARKRRSSDEKNN